ncbi:porin [Vibrio mediterranei]|uniref:Porin n=1 Tax=Vibrio mediterranei TaxID=689 RepID=A0A3G4VHA8_9VIBR|nr:porin [Vibrio mediterranei]AYV24217.1 porin [Vibrio mediterranei]EDL55710.1 outer membrane protein OmpU [Vibrio mediterranei AK1]MCY9852300.1 porin [Vibrio mediterranei]
MKKVSLLTAAIIAGLSATAANAADVYKGDNLNLAVGGRAEARADFDNSSNGRAVTDTSRARVNVLATTEIADGVQAKGFFEEEFNRGSMTDGKASGDGYDNRYLYVGIAGENNELQYGKTDGSLGIITDYTDILDAFGGEAGNKTATADRTTNQLLYIGTFGDLKVKANASGGGSADSFNKYDADISGTVDQGYGIAAQYQLGDLSFGAGYAYQKDTDITSKIGGTTTNIDEAKSQNVLVGAGYQLNDLYLGGLYTQGKLLDQDYKGFEVASKYDLTDRIRLAAAFQQVKFDIADETDQNIAASVHYKFTNYFTTYAGISQDLKGDKDTAGRVGAIVTF